MAFSDFLGKIGRGVSKAFEPRTMELPAVEGEVPETMRVGPSLVQSLFRGAGDIATAFSEAEGTVPVGTTTEQMRKRRYEQRQAQQYGLAEAGRRRQEIFRREQAEAETAFKNYNIQIDYLDELEKNIRTASQALDTTTPEGKKKFTELTTNMQTLSERRNQIREEMGFVPPKGLEVSTMISGTELARARGGLAAEEFATKADRLVQASEVGGPQMQRIIEKSLGIAREPGATYEVRRDPQIGYILATMKKDPYTGEQYATGFQRLTKEQIYDASKGLERVHPVGEPEMIREPIAGTTGLAGFEDINEMLKFISAEHKNVASRVRNNIADMFAKFTKEGLFNLNEMPADYQSVAAGLFTLKAIAPMEHLKTVGAAPGSDVSLYAQLEAAGLRRLHSVPLADGTVYNIPADFQQKKMYYIGMGLSETEAVHRAADTILARFQTEMEKFDMPSLTKLAR